jgi:AcrR family transcriptional regulator
LARAKRDARVAILDAAMELISESSGRKDISVRELAARAGVNLALISYYFGGKEGCLAELYRAKMSAFARLRTASLLDLDAAAGVDTILATWLGPILGLHDRESAERNLLVTFLQTHYPSLTGRLFGEVFESANRALIDALLPRLPFLSRGTVVWRLYALAGAAHLFRDEIYKDAIEAYSNRECRADDQDEQFRQLVAFAVAGFCAAEPAAPVRRTGKGKKKNL